MPAKPATPPRVRHCRVCGQAGHRADGCPTAKASGSERPRKGPAPPSPQELVDVLISAAEALSDVKAAAAVETARAEIWRKAKALRLALIRSRAANARLRAQVEDEKVAHELARLDQAEAGRG